MNTRLTDEQVEREIERLTNNDAVKLARAEMRARYRRRQYLYNLRVLEKRGLVLMAQGKTGADFDDEEGELEEVW